MKEKYNLDYKRNYYQILRVSIYDNSVIPRSTENKLAVQDKYHGVVGEIVLLENIKPNGTYMIAQIRPIQLPLKRETRTIVQIGKDFNICTKKECINKIALKSLKINPKDIDKYTIKTKDEDINSWIKMNDVQELIEKLDEFEKSSNR